MRVLSVIHYPTAGGPHNRNRKIAPLLRKRGIELVALLPDDCSAIEAFRAVDIQVLTLPLSRLRGTLRPGEHLRTAKGLWRDVSSIRQLIESESIDVVLVNGLVNPHAAIAATRERVPVVWQLLDTRTPRSANRVFMLLVRRLADVVMTTGFAVADEHPGATSFGERLLSFYPPVDLDAFRPLDSASKLRARSELGVDKGAFLVGTVGNLNRQKGHEFTLRAVAELRSLGIPAAVRLLGTSAPSQVRYERYLREEAAVLGFSEEVFVDPADRVSELMPAFDVFALASRRRSEGIPTSVLEAFAGGVPVVAADVGAVREVVDDEVDGILIPAEDVSALRDALVRLHERPSLRRCLGKQALTKAPRFDAPACASSHAIAFGLALNSRQSQRPTGTN